MPGLFTLTLNPALDVATSVPEIAPLHKLRCTTEFRSPGGGGINVARALHKLGSHAAAIFLSGGTTGARLAHLLAQEGIVARSSPIDGETRENFAVQEGKTNRQFRFVLPGPAISEAELAACLDAAFQDARAGDFLIASGSLPPNAPLDYYRRVAERAASSSVHLMLDCPAPTLRESLGTGVELIKPSFSEFIALTGVTPTDKEQALPSIRRLIAEKRTQSVALTLGERGAWLVGENFAYAATAPKITARSTIGAGDSFLAGLVCGLASGEAPQDALRIAVAAGTAALLAPGVELCRKDDVDRLIPMIDIVALS